MSWDFAIVRIRGPFRPIEEVEVEDYLAVGNLKSVAAAVRAAFPSAEWSNPKWAVYRGPDFEIEINLDGVESGDEIILHVRGTGDPIASILNLTEANGWLAVDCDSGEFIDPPNPSDEGWEGFEQLVRAGASQRKRRPRNRKRQAEQKSPSSSVLSPSENTQYWLKRLRAEVSIAKPARAVWYGLELAEVEFAHGFDDAARATLHRCLERFDIVHPGHWTSYVSGAARLCEPLSENRLLEPEVRRGVEWLAQPEVVNNQSALPEIVHDIAIQAGRADVAARLVSDQWPGRAANSLVDACRLAGWSRDSAELRRLLPLAQEAIRAAGPGRDYRRQSFDHSLVRACVQAGLFAEASELCETYSFPAYATAELVTVLWATDRATYARIRDGWVNELIDKFRGETDNHYSHYSWALGHCAKMIRRLGDAEGYRNAIKQFHDVVQLSSLRHDSIACAVHCNLAVLYAKAGEGPISTECINNAMRLYEGKVPGVSTERDSRPIMASCLSEAYRDIGEIELAVRFARKSPADDRPMLLISALIIGGWTEAAEVELAKDDSPTDRAVLIAESLIAEFKVGGGQFILPHRPVTST